MASSESQPKTSVDLAAIRVLETWLPIDPHIISDICQNFEAGKYANDPEPLIEDLKKDFNLMSFCLKEMYRKQDAYERLAEPNPLAAFRKVPLDEMRLILDKASRLSDERPLQYLNTAQSRKLKDLLIASAAAQTLSHKYELNTETALSCALFRHLGMMLIVWNYPTVFKRVIDANSSPAEVDQKLSSFLGFSPGVLGMTIARALRLPAVIRRGMGDNNLHGVISSQEERTGALLEKICRVGEVLAAVNNPEHQHVSDEEWRLTKWEIISRLGVNGFKTIQNSFSSACAHYQNILSDTDSFAPIAEPNDIAGIEASRQLLEKNIHLKNCEPSVRDDITRVYADLDPTLLSAIPIDNLKRHAIPAAGFERGVVYLIDPDNGNLVPKLAIGATHIADFQAIKNGPSLSSSDIAARAFRSIAPITQARHDAYHRAKVYSFAGALGSEQRLGVIILETTTPAAEIHQAAFLNHFKALRQCMADCLHLC